MSGIFSDSGYFIFTENLPHYNKPGKIHALRSKENIFNFLDKAGLKQINVIPMTIFLNNPLNKNKFYEWVYKLQNKILFRYPSKAYKERAGNVLGFIFYWIDRLLLPFIKQGPSNHMIICKKCI